MFEIKELLLLLLLQGKSHFDVWSITSGCRQAMFGLEFCDGGVAVDKS